MNTDSDLTRDLQSWLHEDAHEYGDRVLNRVVELLDSTPQRPASWLARRFQSMNTTPLRFGLAAAAVAIVAFIILRGVASGPAPGTSPSPEPSMSPTETAVSSEPTELPVGSSYALTDIGEVLVSVVIPASGWFDNPAAGASINATGGNPGIGGLLDMNLNGGGAPDGALILGFGSSVTVPGDACNWESHPDATVTWPFDETVNRLVAQLSRDTSGPTDVTLGGYPAKALTLHVPADTDFAGCYQGRFCMLTTPYAVRSESCVRYAQAPDQIDELWIVDVNGQWAMIDAAYYSGTPSDDLDAMRAMILSATVVRQTETP